ncbi:hypothetical protein AB0A74_01090 [Saccharothrix sp. NPDC042600]|uniref:hypothetical protein n=1 Tax=Saccharothrix TaxID=2071 RepID=UPI0033DB8965|nr:hypothetical protein GCM10017745_49220 [Saccharothrix mutabilis subsp. capreolus]
MPTTEEVRLELTRRPILTECCRRSEATGMLWFGGATEVTRPPTRCVDFDHLWLAHRLLTLVDGLAHPDLAVDETPGGRRYRVRVPLPDTHTADLSPPPGAFPLPGVWAVGSSRCDARSLWRGAFLTGGRIRVTGTTIVVDVRCPDLAAVRVLRRSARRLGVRCHYDAEPGWPAVTVREPHDVRGLLEAMGAEQAFSTTRHGAATRPRQRGHATGTERCAVTPLTGRRP